MINISYNHTFCTVTFEREKQKNALTKQMYYMIIEAFKKTLKSDSVKALIIRAKGDYFCAGHDIEEFIKKPEDFTKDHPLLEFLGYLEKFPKILIFVLEGHAIGIGATMLLHGDFIIAKKNIEISMPFVQMGLCAEAGSSQLLELIAGKALANEMLLLGRSVKAERLKGTLINELTSSKMQTNAMLALVKKQINMLPLSGILKNKDLMRRRSEDITTTMEREIESFAFLLKSKETQRIITNKVNQVKKPKSSSL